MAEQTPAETPEQWESIGKQISAGIIDTLIRSNAAKATTALLADTLGALVGVAVTLTAPVGIGLARGIAESEDQVAPALAEMAAAAVKDMFGVAVPESAFREGVRHGSRRTAADALGAGLIDQLKGPATSLEPDDRAASRFLGVVVNMALEGWYQKWFFEFVSSLIPQLDIGKIESFGSLDDKMAQALGLGRLTRRVLSPIIDASVVTPLRWQTHKVYRPELLSPGDVARQVLRGRWTPAEGQEELARQGYATQRIEAILNAQRKFFGAGDVRTFVMREHWSQEEGVQHLRDQGYDETSALDALRLEGLHRLDQLEGQEASVILNAYANYEIDHGEFVSLLGTYVHPATERALLEELGNLRRQMSAKGLSSSNVEQMVKAKILAFVDYRRALEREGYEPSAILNKELLLRWEIDRETGLEEHRRRAEEERAKEQRQRDEEREKRRREVEEARALTRRGDESDLERAAVRGLVPFARVEEIYRPRYDTDTVAILIDLLEAARQDYLEAERKRAEAERRAFSRGIDLGDVEQAVLRDVLTLDQYRARLTFEKFPPADIDVLVETLRAQKRDLDEARRKRDEAEAAARNKQIDIGRFERLVRKGARSYKDYDALLRTLGFNEAARAAILELLLLEIEEDRKADAARRDAAAALSVRGLSLEEWRRAVILGLKPRAAYEQFLVAQGFTADKQILFLRELDLAVADVEAARQRRAQAEAAIGARELPLSTIARAARLGVVTPETYEARLVRAGFTPDDIAIDLDLLLFEIADTQAARTKREEREQAAQRRGVSLADVERAVKAGAATIDDYRARALAIGYDAADTTLLVDLLARELAAIEDARRRREEIEGQLKPRALSLGTLEAAVKEGLKSIETFLADVQALGYAPEDAELLAALLTVELERKTA